MIVLKQLAREYSDANPHKMRIILRQAFGNKRAWRWQDNDKQLAKVHKVLRKHFKETPK